MKTLIHAVQTILYVLLFAGVVASALFFPLIAVAVGFIYYLYTVFADGDDCKHGNKTHA